MKKKLRQAYLRGMTDLAICMCTMSFLAWTSYKIFEKLLS